MPAPAPWVFWTGLPILAVGLSLLVWMVMADRIRFRRSAPPRRCPRCWYSMSGVPTLQCPECGHRARTEKQLHRYRRRWRWVFAGGVLGLVGAFGVSYRYWYEMDWLRLLPSWALLAICEDVAPKAGRWSPSGGALVMSPDQLIADELWRRYEAGELSLTQRRVLLTAFHTAARPPALVTTRARWPEGVPVRVLVRTADTAARDQAMRASAQGGDGTEIRSARLGWFCDDRFRAYTHERFPHWPEHNVSEAGVLQSIGALAPGPGPVSLDARLMEGDEEAWSGKLTIQTSVGGTLEEVLQADPATDVTESISGVAIDSLRISPDRLAVVMNHPRVNTQGLAIGLRIEIRHHESVVASARMLFAYQAPPPPNSWRESAHFDPVCSPLNGDREALASANFEDPAWTVRIVGDPIAALDDFEAVRYWTGSITMPVDPAMRPASETASPKPSNP